MFDKLKFFLAVIVIISGCSDDTPKIKKVIVKDNSARLVDNPKTKSPITFIPIGTELEVVKVKDVKRGLFNTTWFQVTYQDTIGWINMFFVTIDSTAKIEDMKKIFDNKEQDKTVENSYDSYDKTGKKNELNETNAYNELPSSDTNNEVVNQINIDISDQSIIVEPNTPSQKFYTIQITSGKDLDAAEALVRFAKSIEVDAYIQKGYVDNKGAIWYRVRSGKYQSLEAAETASIIINEKMNINSWVDNFRIGDVAKEELKTTISESLESLPMFNEIDPWMKENIINYNSIKYIKWYDPYIRGTFHLQRVRFSILSNQKELLIDEREFKFWDGKLYSVFDNQGRQLQ